MNDVVNKDQMQEVVIVAICDKAKPKAKWVAKILV